MLITRGFVDNTLITRGFVGEVLVQVVREVLYLTSKIHNFIQLRSRP